MNNILSLLASNQAVLALENKEGNLASVSLVEEALLVSSYFKKTDRNIIIVKNNLYNAQRLYDMICTMLNNDRVLLFGVEESLRIEAIAASPELMADKIDTLNKLCDNGNHILITHTAGILKHLPKRDYFVSRIIKLKINQEITIDKLSYQLSCSGYQLVSRVDQPLTFAKRGGIIDVYSLNYKSPIRIEFFDNNIESIRYFDISTQRTINLLDEVSIIPGTDILFTDDDIKEIVTKVQLQLIKEKEQLSSDDFIIIKGMPFSLKLYAVAKRFNDLAEFMQPQ